jgi:hypothetical protein
MKLFICHMFVCSYTTFMTFLQIKCFRVGKFFFSSKIILFLLFFLPISVEKIKIISYYVPNQEFFMVMQQHENQQYYKGGHIN